MTLDLDNNRISTLPTYIGKLTNLKMLFILNNPLPIPPEILRKTVKPAEIIQYYLQLIKAETQPINEAKIVIVGQAAVGKTSLVKRLIEDKFNPHEAKTEGIEIRRWEVSLDKNNIRLNVWDFGGQEIMHATHQFFLTKRSLYILVLDSRLDEQENRVEYWLKIIQSFGGDSPILIVCNKCDQHSLDLDWRGLTNKYPNIKDILKRFSCPTGEGREELIKMIQTRLSQLKHLNDLLPSSWFAVKTKLENMKRDYIAYKDYQKICSKEGIRESSDQNLLLGLLHDLGTVLHFGDYPNLDVTNVLNPEWVTQGVYQIINSAPQ